MCESSITLTIVLYARIILKITQIVVPIILVITMGIEILKTVISDDVDLKKLLKKFENKLLACGFIFILPFVVTFTCSLFGTLSNFDTEYNQCWNTVDRNMIEYYSALEQAEFDKKYSDNSNKIQQDKIKLIQAVKTSESSVQMGDYTFASDENGIVLDTNDATKISNISPQDLLKKLENGSSSKVFIPYVNTFVATEQEYKVNLFIRIGMIANESGWGTSPLAIDCNNWCGIKATSSDEKCDGGSFAKYDSVDESIIKQAKLLHNSYLTPGGTYYEGLGVSDIVKHYAGDGDDREKWVSNVIEIATSIYKS